ncbi:MAG TPA: AAA family ATPase [Gaiellaceae bacterium]|nr:AAA family ATPase [Gaiellaceae bacterium]
MSFLRSVVLKRDEVESFGRYPYAVPAIRTLDELELDPAVTLLVGENGSGKSTLVEAIAVAAGFNAEGGSRNMRFATRDSVSDLHEHLRLVRTGRRPRTGFFLRTESFFNVATQVEELGAEIASAYGERSLHEQSHGESFLSLVTNRFGRDGLYLLDEPEAVLSVRGILALIRRMHDLVAEGSQFVVATHSPILLGFPAATIYELGEDGFARVAWEQTEHVQLTRSFLEDPGRFLRHLLAD